jgi:hypothetical protein
VTVAILGLAAPPVALSWPTIASLATAGGTLILAVATFASVRSANRSARVAELALQEQRRPVVVQSRLDDPIQKIMFVDGHWVHVPGSGGVVEHLEGNVYLAMSLRNVGAGIGVMQAWTARVGLDTSREHAPEQSFRMQSRDLYIPAGDVGLWQGALRDAAEDAYAAVAQAATARQTLSIELLYTDQAGAQRTISRFQVVPVGEDRWTISVGRHWYLEAAGPR